MLDEYVIEQDYAKKVLAVAVHNHYKRLDIVDQHRMMWKFRKAIFFSSAPPDAEKPCWPRPWPGF